MVLKTFNVEEDVYNEFSSFCKSNGISMSKQVDNFMRSFMTDKPEIRPEYLQKLEKIRKGNFRRVGNFAKEFGLE